LPNLWNLLGDTNIYYDEDPDTNELWAIEATLAENARINTFIREDWLKKLNLPLPTTEEEFHDCLVAFRDNAETLLGADAARMIPYTTSYDIGWRNDHLFAAYVPNDITDETMYVYGFDDRHMLYPGIKEGVRTLNKWYNEGLVWKDFALYGSGDTTEDDMMKAGFVGAFQHNWDYPFRNEEDSIAANLKRNVGEDAAYIAVDCFKNDAGLYRKFLSASIDRKVFFPFTNDEPVASLLYLDFISDPETIKYMQMGEEGINHNVLENGAYEKITETDPAYKMNSANNIDYTITVNGLYLGEATAETTALSYTGIPSTYVVTALAASKNEGRIPATFHCGAIAAEEGVGTSLSEKRDGFLCRAVTASEDQFDAIYDEGMNDYLVTGGQDIINERNEKLQKYYGVTVE
ncbi:MAG: sugar ABC transporter substrate-binding protein, partial [Clostridia bacterium]|nr:sugar ABC transporter substrate-binding protein [Clostridia bacterium]